ncbi:IS21 family transposase [Roseiconus lacunae]|uniref:IS21 family transposase n=1 Tax=Roseiconus lacunae TaxID=2605694 RepID=UPI001E4A3DB8|nr:IS21 family transposase [Roseiconus lacunae]MCD0462261.1 IS21 family transposase [Roseiconus lacunae]
MARQLTMAKQTTIQTLHQAGHSQREIARLTGVHRETVGKYLSGDEIPAKPDHRVSGPKNECEQHRELILEKVAQGLSGVRIHQDLCADHGFTASYSSVRRFLQKLNKTVPLPVRRIETAPGEEAQVDFGTAAPVIGSDGSKRRPWMFRFVLSHSRKAYSEVVYRQTTENFVTAIENAFHYFGGVPKRIVIDNLKAAVAKADWYDPELHPKLQSLARHYGTVILPTKPYTPQHKGKVESGVKYAKNKALKGRSFQSLSAQNEHLLQWEQTVADTRIHGTTKKQVGRLFEESERATLMPLPTDRFPCFQEAKRSVHRDGHVEVEKSYYSVPPEYTGRRLWVRWDGRLVRIFNDRWEQVALHPKVDPGKFGTASDHIPKEKFSAVERGAQKLLQRIEIIGPHTSRWAQAVTQVRGVEAVRVLVGLKSLAKKHSSAELEQACKTALSHGAMRLRAIRQLLKRGAGNVDQQQFEFLEHHPVIRPLSDYSLDSLHAFRKERHENLTP